MISQVPYNNAVNYGPNGYGGRYQNNKESAEEYIRVFELLLFEECRAQLYSSYEGSHEAVSRDAHVMLHVKTVDRHERGWYKLWFMHSGWYNVVMLPTHEYKWTFKEGEVAILSFIRPGSGHSLKTHMLELRFHHKITTMLVCMIDMLLSQDPLTIRCERYI